ncbi:hypothetical protein pb186bvf_012217 [Paramecium bursaria]
MKYPKDIKQNIIVNLNQKAKRILGIFENQIEQWIIQNLEILMSLINFYFIYDALYSYLSIQIDYGNIGFIGPRDTCINIRCLSFINLSFLVEGILNGRNNFNIDGQNHTYFQVVGLDPDPINNQVFIGENPCRIPEDGINGLTLKCITVATDPTETIIPFINYNNWWYSNGVWGLIVVKVKDKEDSQYYNYLGFQQSIDFTPLIKNVFPHNMIPGNILQLDTQFQYYWDLDSTFKLGQQICKSLQIQNNLCQIPNIEAGYYDYSLDSTQGNSYNLYDVYQKKVYENVLFQGKVIPIIKKLSSNQGSQKGQILDINGLGFSEDINNIKVQVSGYNLTTQILKSNLTNIQVKIQNFTKKQQNLFLQGSGLRYTRYNLIQTQYDTCPKFIQQLNLNQTKLQDLIVIDEIASETELFRVNNFNYSDHFRGFFKAPKTGQYRFYIQSDDWSALYFQIQPNIMNKTNLTMILQNDRGNFRQYYQEYNQNSQKSHRSEYINLNQNDYHYLEIIHCSFQYSGHLSISVEIEEEQKTKRSLTDVYVFNNSLKFIPQIVEIYMYNSEGDYLLQGQYRFCILYVETNISSLNFDEIDQFLDYNSTAEQFKKYIDQQQFMFYGYGWLYQNQNITAQKVNFQGIPIKNQSATQFAGYKYTITFNNQVWAENYLYARPTLIPQNITFEKGTPYFGSKLIQNQSQPLQGQFQIQVTYLDQQGEIQQTLLQSPNEQPSIDINNLQCYSISFYFSKIFKKQPLCWSNDNTYYQNRVVLQFRDIDELIDMEIVNQNLTSGDQNVEQYLSKVFEKSNNTLYEPIPNELLYTFSDFPQVNLYVNDILAVCFGDVCKYEVSSTISSTLINFSITNNLLIMELSPSIQQKEINSTLLNISYGGSQCTQIDIQKKGSNYLIQCQLELLNGQLIFEAGDNFPKIHIYPQGFVNIDNKVTPKQQNITISSISPSIGSSSGGALITITGNGFPRNVNSINDFVIKISGQVATPLFISNQQIQVITPSQQTDNKVEIEFNGKYFQSTTLFQYDQSQMVQIQSLEFNDRSPIFKGYMKIIATNLGLDLKQLNCTLENVNKTYIAPIKSIEGNTLTVYLRGGMPGEYQIIINKLGYGKSWPMTQGSNKFKYGVFITSVSPQIGSEGGGTIITITGRNIVLDETLVFIGNALNQYCDVNLTLSTDNAIVCTTSPKPDLPYYSKPVEVAVITRGSLESICEQGANCSFSYLDELTPRLLSRPSGLLDLNNSSNSRIITRRQRCESSKSGVSHFSSKRRTLQMDENENQQYKSYSYGQIENIIINSGQEDKYQVVFKGDKYYYVTDAIIDENDKNSIQYSIPNIPQGDYQTFISTGKGYADLTWITRIELLILSYPQFICQSGQDIQIQGQGFNKDQKLKVVIGDQQCLNLTFIDFNLIECQTAKLQYNWQQNLILTQIDQVTDKLISTIKPINLIQSQTIIYGMMTSDYIIPNEYNFNFIGDKTLINITITGNNLNQGIDSKTIFKIIKQFFSLEASFQNIPIGKFAVVLKIDGQYVYSEFKLFIQGDKNITSQLIQSSIAGGSYLNFLGTGFDLQKNNNKVKVCGFECNVLSTSLDSLVCETPAVFTQQNLEDYPTLSTEFRTLDFKDFYFDSSEKNQQEYFSILFDGSQQTCVQQNGPQSYIILEIESNMVLELKSIRYQSKLEKYSLPQLNGTIIQYVQVGQNYWRDIIIITTNIQLGYNTIYLDKPIKNIKKLKIYDEQSTGRCQICELKINGRLTYDQQDLTNQDVFCDALLSINDFQVPLFEKIVQYQVSQTPIVESVSHEFVPTDYSTDISIQGFGFGDDQSIVQVSIDNVICDVNDVSDNSIKCKTGVKDLSINKITGLFKVQINGSLAINKEKVQYGNLWSDINTWGGAVFPSDGDSVIVQQGQILIVDMITPQLVSILVEGTISFADKGSETSLNAKYIIFHNGKLNIGSELRPYQSKATITLRGEWEDIQMPGFGNKVLGCYQCQFQIFGRQRTPVWTTLKNTIKAGDSLLVVDNSVDWQVGEQIIVTSSDFDQYQTEKRTITKIMNDQTIQVDKPFQYQHYAAIETYGNIQYSNKAEVGLLSRNILITAEISKRRQYGYHFKIYGDFDSGTLVQISYAEFQNGGQPTIKGRHPFYFKENGDLNENYLIGNSIHNNQARCITLNNVKYLLIENNICYNTFGHSIFFETGYEVNNVVRNNLVAVSKSIFILLQIDITATSFYIQNPVNIITGNVAAGSDYSGFTFDFEQNSEYVIADCRSGTLITDFNNNTAHSNQYYGLYIMIYIPRVDSCNNQVRLDYDPDPYKQQYVLKDTFNNFKAKLTGQYGIYINKIGNIQINNLQASDNKVAAVYIQESDWTKQGFLLSNSLIIGKSQNTINKNYYSSALQLPKTQNYAVQNTYIHNYNKGDVVFKVDSFWPGWYWQIAISYMFTEVKVFNSEQSQYIDYSFTTSIIWNLDGSLNSNQIPSYLISHKTHIIGIDGCQSQSDIFWNGGVFCDMSKTVVRDLTFNQAYSSSYKFASITQANIRRIQQDQLTLNENNYQLDQYQQDPLQLIFVTNKQYNLHFPASFSVNPERLQLIPSNYLKDDDKGIILRFNLSLEISKITFQSTNRSNQPQTRDFNMSKNPLDTLSCAYSDWYLDNSTNCLYICISSLTKNLTDYLSIMIEYVHKKIIIDTPSGGGGYIPPPIFNFICGQRMKWSDPQAWPLGGALPDLSVPTLKILACQEILIDINPAPLNQIVVFGTLIFDETRTSTTLSANNIEILSGKIIAGSATNPYKGIINIYINGDQYTNLLMVAGTLELYGNAPSSVQTRLTNSAKKGDSIIQVENSQDWVEGDTLIIGPSGSDPLQTEEGTIQSIDDNSITLQQPLQFSHYGSTSQTINQQNIGILDMRAIVGHLTRNIKIISGQNQNGYGCRITVEKYNENIGYLKLRGVEIQKCGQPYADESPALDIISMSSDNYIYLIDSCSIHHSSGTQLRIQKSKSIQITNNIFYHGSSSLVILNNNLQLSFQYNLLMFAKSGTFGSFTNEKSNDNQVGQLITNNVGTASQDSGFVFMSSSCNTNAPQFISNQCSSVNFVCFEYITLDGVCDQISSAFAYHSQIGIKAVLWTNQINIQAVILVENSINLVTRMLNKQILSNEMYVSNSFISSFLRPECQNCYSKEFKPYCQGSVGIQMATVSGSTTQRSGLNDFYRIDVISTVSAIDARVYMDSVIFDGFKHKYTETDSCGSNAVFRQHPQASDMSAQYYLTNTKCQNCNKEGLFFGLRQPDPMQIGWLGGCGTFQCTGHINILIEDQDGQFLGQQSQAIGNNFYYAPNTTYCTRVDAWIGFLCQEKQISVLNFMSTAPDKNKRLYSPIQLTDGKFFNQINSFREWQWNGNQPMNKRESRFVSIIQVNTVINMTNAGDNPTESIYWLSKKRPSGSPSDWIILQWQFSTPNIIQISVNNKTILPGITLNNEHWELDKKISECGANNYFYQNRTIHFVVTGDISCIVKVSLKNTMQISSRIAVTENQFLGKNFLQFAFASLGGDPYNYFILGIKKVSRRALQGQSYIDVDWGYADPAPIGSTESDDSQNRLQNLTEKITTMQSAPESPYKILSSNVQIKTVDINSFKSTEPQVNDNIVVNPIPISTSQSQQQINTDYIYVPPKTNSTENATIQQNSTNETLQSNQTKVNEEQNDNTTKIIVASVVPVSIIIIIAIGLIILKRRAKHTRMQSYQVENDQRLNEPQNSNIQSRQEQVPP